MSQVITKQDIIHAMSYQEYRDLTDRLLEENKTTGENHSPAMIEYTRMNVQRMKRADKTAQINDSLEEKLSKLSEKWYWLVLTEAWCGDAAQNIPVIAKMAELSDKIELKLILRDEHHHIMDEFLTNGGRSIPKLVCLRASDLEVLGTWGPRPAEAQKMVIEMKQEELDFKVAAEKLHGWYAKNKYQDIQDEFENLLNFWSRN